MKTILAIVASLLIACTTESETVTPSFLACEEMVCESLSCEEAGPDDGEILCACGLGETQIATCSVSLSQ